MTGRGRRRRPDASGSGEAAGGGGSFLAFGPSAMYGRIVLHLVDGS